MALKRRPIGMEDPAALNAINSARRYQRAQDTFKRATARANRQAQMKNRQYQRYQSMQGRTATKLPSPAATATQRSYASTQRREAAFNRRVNTGTPVTTDLNARKKTMPVQSRRQNTSALRKKRTLERYQNALRKLGR